MAKQATREITNGPLYRASAGIYGVLGPTVCFLVACLPFAVVTVLVPSAVAIAVAGILIGPAWTALLYAARIVSTDRERGPIAAYWRGYRLNWRQTLAVWTPYWILLVIAATDVTSTATPLALRWIVGIVAAVSLLWISAVLLLISRYAFRLRDVLRLGLYLLFAAARSTLTNAALLVVAAAVTYFASEFVLGLLAGVFALFAVIGARGLFDLVDARFTTPPTTEPTAAG
ncbi:DUF624 domain-containing protein [Rathayibacter sp. CAU 1779]